MSENKDRKIILPKSGVFNDLVTRIKLVVRLIGDTRVNPLLKLLPIGAVAYFIIPDLVIGPIDDAAVMWLGGYLFVEMCPPEIVQEHIQAINRLIPGEWQKPNEPEGEIVEGEYWEKRD